MLNRTIIATTAVALLLGLRASAAEFSWSEQRDLDHGRIEAWIEDGWLHARRVEGSDDLVWHVVLGQVEKGDHARFRTTGTAGVGMIDYSHDKAELSDDGEFLQAHYVGMEEAERVLNRIRLELF